MKTPLFLLCWLAAAAGRAQYFRSPLYQRYLETGTYSRHFTDVFSVLGNQATLAQLKIPAAGVYAERRYLLKELNAYTALAAFPLKRAGAAFSASYSGSAGYNESQLALAYGRALGEAVGLGVQFNYNLRSSAGYGSTAAINADIAAMVHLTDKVHAGLHLYNPLGFGKGNHFNDELPGVYTFGLGYEASDKLYCSTTIGKEEDKAVNVNVAMHYAFVPQVFVRAGMATGTGSCFAGAGISWGNCRMDVAALYHPQLGVSPSLSFIFHGKQNAGAAE